MIFMFGIVLLLKAQTYKEARPIPQIVTSLSGEILSTCLMPLAQAIGISPDCVIFST